MDWGYFWSASFSNTFGIVLRSAVIWLPLVLIYIAWNLWLSYVRFKNVVEQKNILLEIKLPKEIRRSPAAMELIFVSLYQSGAATYLETYLKGKFRPWFSAELVSLGGEIHFFLWVPDKSKNIVEAQIYAQYPSAEVREVADYTMDTEYDPEKLTMWAGHFILTKDDGYPIKTYIDYGLDKNTGAKEEEKIDPITVMLEYLGSLRPGEQCWIQILFQANKKEGVKDARLYKRPDWTSGAKKLIETIREDATPDAPGAVPALTPRQNEIIAAIERNMSKQGFEVMIRGIYMGTKEAFNPSNISGMIGSFRQYNSQDLNGFKPGWHSDHKDLGKDLLTLFGFIPWFNNAMAKRKMRQERELMDAYKKRSFFQAPYQNFHNRPYILTTEELATIYHFPGQVATTPSLAKIESKRAEPPANLPI